MKNMRKVICGLNQRLNELSMMLEKLKLAEYLRHLNNPRKIIWVNFLGGLARGFGAAVGFVLLGALAIYILQKSFLQNLPLIGNIVAEIIKIANQRLGLQ
jgi:hypothetical protein